MNLLQMFGVTAAAAGAAFAVSPAAMAAPAAPNSDGCSIHKESNETSYSVCTSLPSGWEQKLTGVCHADPGHTSYPSGPWVTNGKHSEARRDGDTLDYPYIEKRGGGSGGG